MPKRARWCGGIAVASCPSITTRPARGGSRPIKVRSVVVLPAPLRPINATRPPGGTTRWTSRSTGTPTMSIETLCSSSMSGLDPDHVTEDSGIRQDLLRRAKGGDAPLAPDRDAVGEAGNDVHVVLHEDRRHAGIAQHAD